MPKFPFTNYHELNLDWILKKVTALFDASEENAQTIRTYNTRLTAAEQTATSAATAATAAQQLADAASENADSALSVAGTANTKADSALTAATTAASAANNALTIAQEARQIAGNAQSAAADAGAVANDASNTAEAAQQTADTNAGNIANLQTAVDTLSSAVTEIDNKADVIIDSASGSIASFADGANDMPIRSLIVNIEPVQAGSGDPSPTNIRPITWHTGATIRHDKYIVGFEQGGLRDSDGLPAAVNTRIRTGAIPVDAFPNATNEILLLYNGSQNIVLRAYYWYNSNDTFIQKTGTPGPLIPINKVNIPSSAAYARVVLQCSDETLEISPDGVYIDINPSEPIGVSWQSAAGTVYGGTLDLISGLLTVTDFLYIYDGTEPFSKSGTALNGYYNNLYTSDPPHGWPKLRNYSGALGTLTDEISSMFKMTNDASVYRNNYGYLMLDTGMNFSVDPDMFGSTVDSFKAKLAELYNNGTPVSVYAEILTPQTYQLTPQQISTLLGQNSIYSDVGSIANVQYPADTKLYIDGKIAELQALVLEN